MKRINIVLSIVLLFASMTLAGGVRILKKSTAITIAVGPFYSSTDHVTRATSIDAAEWTCNMVKGVTGSVITVTASGGDNDAAFITNGGGTASIELTASDTDTVGDLRLEITDPNNDSITELFEVVDPNFFDLRRSGILNVSKVGGNTLPMSAASMFSDLSTNTEQEASIKAILDSKLPGGADANTVTVADGKIAATATVDSSSFASDLLDTVIYGHKVSWYLYQLGIPTGRFGKGTQNPPE